MMMKTSMAFGYKASSSTTKGCNCKKTGCLKKYCECFNEGVKCNEYCKCNNCGNAPWLLIFSFLYFFSITQSIQIKRTEYSLLYWFVTEFTLTWLGLFSFLEVYPFAVPFRSPVCLPLALFFLFISVEYYVLLAIATALVVLLIILESLPTHTGFRYILQKFLLMHLFCHFLTTTQQTLTLLHIHLSPRR